MENITIGLNMMVRNEAKVIERCLTSVLPIIDYYCIVDNDSTDNTKDVIKSFFKNHNIQGEIHDYKELPFIACEVRQFALERLGQKTTFGFYIDADDQLILPDNFNKESFKYKISLGDFVPTKVKEPDRVHNRNALWRTDKGFIWDDPAHDRLEATQYVIPAEPDENFPYILYGNDGNSWTDPKKHLRRIEIYHEWIKKKGEKSRYFFNLAQEYACAGILDQAMIWYKNAKSITQSIEERYFSQYQIAKLSANLKYPTSEVITNFMMCSELDPLRSEHLVALIEIFQSASRYEIAFIYSEYAMNHYYKNNPFPKRTYFIEDNCYNENLLLLHNENCNKTERKNIHV